MNVSVFSGRFDPFHIGHLLTIYRIIKESNIIIIPVLDYEGRVVSAKDTAGQMLEAINPICHGCALLFYIGKTHFSEISREEYLGIVTKAGIGLNNEILYFSGNQEVLDHMKEIGVKNIFVPRSNDGVYSGTIIREGICQAKKQ